MSSPENPPWPRKLWHRREFAADAVVALTCVIGTFAWSGPDQFTAESSFFPVLQGTQRLVAAVPLACLAAAAAMVRRRRPLLLLLVSLLGWTTISAITVVVCALYALGAFESSRKRVTAATAVTLVLVGFPFWYLGGFDATIPISTAVCLVPTLLGLWVAARRTLVNDLHERADRLERERDLRAEQARAGERTRIARDMHDVVAHRVSLIVLHAATAEVVGEPERIELVRQIRSIGRSALDELRQVLGVLRTGDAPLTPQPTLDDLAGLVAQSRAAGMTVEVETIGKVRTLPVIVEQAGYRVTQEALTNVHKHAGNARTRIRLIHAPGTFQLVITNRQPSAGRPTMSLPSSGHGLIGLSERIRLIGGELTTSPTLDGGFEVVATMPLPQEPPA